MLLAEVKIGSGRGFATNVRRRNNYFASCLQVFAFAVSCKKKYKYVRGGESESGNGISNRLQEDADVEIRETSTLSESEGGVAVEEDGVRFLVMQLLTKL